MRKWHERCAQCVIMQWATGWPNLCVALLAVALIVRMHLAPFQLN